MPTIMVLLCGAVIGAVAVKPIRKAWRKARKTEDSARDASEREAFEKGKVQGKAEALSVLCDTDENAAIIEALGAEVLYQHGVERLKSAVQEEFAKRMNYGYAMWGTYVPDRAWTWADPTFTRANLKATGPTPRDAYKSYLAQREAAKAICEQLDELDRVRKEQVEATRA